MPDLPDGFTRSIKISSLARIDVDLPPTGHRLIYRSDPSSTPRQSLSTWSWTPEITGAEQLTHYVTTGAENTRWRLCTGT